MWTERLFCVHNGTGWRITTGIGLFGVKCKTVVILSVCPSHSSSHPRHTHTVDYIGPSPIGHRVNGVDDECIIGPCLCIGRALEKRLKFLFRFSRESKNTAPSEHILQTPGRFSSAENQRESHFPPFCPRIKTTWSRFLFFPLFIFLFFFFFFGPLPSSIASTWDINVV